jgi:hypothetical protein
VGTGALVAFTGQVLVNLLQTMRRYYIIHHVLPSSSSSAPTVVSTEETSTTKWPQWLPFRKLAPNEYRTSLEQQLQEVDTQLQLMQHNLDLVGALRRKLETGTLEH